MSETKQSKFEKKLLEKMDAEKDQAVVVKRAFRQAESLVTQQIAALEHERVNLEILAEEKKEALDAETYSTSFSLTKYDNAKLGVDEVQDRLAEIDATVQARKELLESWK